MPKLGSKSNDVDSDGGGGANGERGVIGGSFWLLVAAFAFAVAVADVGVVFVTVTLSGVVLAVVLSTWIKLDDDDLLSSLVIVALSVFVWLLHEDDKYL